jgi:hypothetical protein
MSERDHVDDARDAVVRIRATAELLFSSLQPPPRRDPSTMSMWAKFSSALKSTTAKPQVSEDPPPATPAHFGPSRAETPQSIERSQAEVTAHLLGESYSDSPAYGGPSSSHIPPVAQSSPPPSPSRRSLFKRSKDTDSVRGASASLKLLPKKIRGNLPFGNGMFSPLSC